MPRKRPGFSNKYVFAKVMKDHPELCCRILETILGREIGEPEEVTVEESTASVYVRDVRFDAVVRCADELFDLEMQAYRQEGLQQRVRLAHAHLARLALDKGERFYKLKPAYVIFICTHDPIGAGAPVYTVTSTCAEIGHAEFGDGAKTIILNATADLSGLSDGLRGLLAYVLDGEPRSDALAADIDDAVEEAFMDEKWSLGIWTYEDEIDNVRYCARAEALREGEAKGEAKGRAEGLIEQKRRDRELIEGMRAEGKSADEILAAILAE